MATIAPAQSPSSLRRPRRSFLRLIFASDAMWRERRALRDLPPHRLTDLGLTAAEAEVEASRPIWDVPPGWRS